jgi:hypothetical protein
VEALADNGQYILGNPFYPKRTLCPIIDHHWFSKAVLLPAEPARPQLPKPLPEQPATPTYPRHHVPTIPLDDLAVGEAVDAPAGRYSVAMISDIVATYGKRAAEAGEKERIFGMFSTATTHTIWREIVSSAKPISVGQECWIFVGSAAAPLLMKGHVDERNELQQCDFSAPMGRTIITTYKVQFRTHASNLTTTGWIDRVYATKEEAIASLGGGE